MDAVKFIKERNRMCDMESCSSCHANFLNDCSCTTEDIVKLVEIVEQWSHDHPQKTIMQDFFEKFPNAPKHENGTPKFPCPSHLGYGNLKKKECEFFQGNCSKCWNRPLED